MNRPILVLVMMGSVLLSSVCGWSETQGLQKSLTKEQEEVIRSELESKGIDESMRRSLAAFNSCMGEFDNGQMCVVFFVSKEVWKDCEDQACLESRARNWAKERKVKSDR